VGRAMFIEARTLSNLGLLSIMNIINNFLLNLQTAQQYIIKLYPKHLVLVELI
jgi:hypothetical protein